MLKRWLQNNQHLYALSGGRKERSPACAGLRSSHCCCDQPRNGFGSGAGSGTGQPSEPMGWPAVEPGHLSSQLLTPSPSSSRSAQVLAGGGGGGGAGTASGPIGNRNSMTA